jgi:hypothetical protein
MANGNFLVSKTSYLGAQNADKYETFSKGMSAVINASAASYETRSGIFPGMNVSPEETTTTTTTTSTTTTTTTTV